MKNIIIKKAAEKYLDKQPAQTTARILLAIYRLPKGDIKPLQNMDGAFRLRVGDIRIVFTTQGNQITIYDINNRGDIYK